MEEERENLDIKKAQKKLKKNLSQILHKRKKTNNFVSFIDLAINGTSVCKEYKSFICMNDYSSKRLFETCDTSRLTSGMFNRKLLCAFGINNVEEKIESREKMESRDELESREKIESNEHNGINKYKEVERREQNISFESKNNIFNSKKIENNLEIKVNNEGDNGFSKNTYNKDSLTVNPFISLNSLNSLNSEVKKDDKIYNLNGNLNQKNVSFFGSILDTEIKDEKEKGSVGGFGLVGREDIRKEDISVNKYLNTSGNKIKEQDILNKDLILDKSETFKNDKIEEKNIKHKDSISSPKRQENLSKVSSNDHSSGFLSKFTFYDSSDMPESEDKFVEIKNEISEDNKIGLVSFINRSSDNINNKFESSFNEIFNKELYDREKDDRELDKQDNREWDKQDDKELDKQVKDDKQDNREWDNSSNMVNITTTSTQNKKPEISFFDLLNTKKVENLNKKTELNFSEFKFEIGNLKHIIFKETPDFKFFYEDGTEIKY
ncbi:hypothetical protein CWI37_1492p0020 [Hamiltosporidium tvaerminnensis]|uniref:Uncharacterized protein n=1 Tax=Hamiltosporidium tvaerminnensis TaxID=1176355 RepID=A0A4Q9KVU5_9MICR|nr:hypothetical protein CWI37_1492p0020 [Hamiltosporidium tvaerminnensis]